MYRMTCRRIAIHGLCFQIFCCKVSDRTVTVIVLTLDSVIAPCCHSHQNFNFLIARFMADTAMANFHAIHNLYGNEPLVDGEDVINPETGTRPLVERICGFHFEQSLVAHIKSMLLTSTMRSILFFARLSQEYPIVLPSIICRTRLWNSRRAEQFWIFLARQR